MTKEQDKKQDPRIQSLIDEVADIPEYLQDEFDMEKNTAPDTDKRTIEDIRQEIKDAEAKVKALWDEFWKFQKDCPHLKRDSTTGTGGYHIEKCVRCRQCEYI